MPKSVLAVALAVALLVLSLFLIVHPVYAAVIGQPCTPSEMVVTQKSDIQTQGVIQCIPNNDGQFLWQAMGAGQTLYDASATCSVPGQIRWNGSAVQYCNASGAWTGLGGGAVGKLYWAGNSNTYWCDPGYHVVQLHFDCGCSNNATWFECQAN